MESPILFCCLNVSVFSAGAVLTLLWFYRVARDGAFVKPPELLFLLRVTSASPGLLCLCVNFKIILYSFVKNATGNLMNVMLNLQISLGHLPISTVLIMPSTNMGTFHHRVFFNILPQYIKILIAERHFTSLHRLVTRDFLKLCFIYFNFIILCDFHIIHPSTIHFPSLRIYPLSLQPSPTEIKFKRKKKKRKGGISS